MEKSIQISFLHKLMQKWQLKSIYQVLMVLLVFTLTGSTVVLLRKTLFNLLGFTEETSFWVKAITYIIFIFPSYQVLLLTYGFLLGQFNFFWQKEKKLLQRMRLLPKKQEN